MGDSVSASVVWVTLWCHSVGMFSVCDSDRTLLRLCMCLILQVNWVVQLFRSNILVHVHPLLTHSHWAFHCRSTETLVWSSVLLRNHLTMTVEAAASYGFQAHNYSWQPYSHKPTSLNVSTYKKECAWLTVDGHRVEGKCCIQRQTVHSHLPTLNAIPVVPQRSCAIKFVMETCSGAVVHTYQDIIQSPLGRVFPCKQ